MVAKNTLRLLTIIDAKILMIQIQVSVCFQSAPKECPFLVPFLIGYYRYFFYKIC